MLKKLFPKKDAFFLQGEFEDIYFEILESKGASAARFWYRAQVFKTAPGFLSYSLSMSAAMLKNYFISAMRNLKKHKFYTLINISGLAVGFAGFALFALIAGVNFNADKFHENADRIFGVIQVLNPGGNERQHTIFSPTSLLPELKNEFSEIEAVVRVLPGGRRTLKRGDENFYEDRILFTDKDFLTFFTFDMILGNPETALSQPNSVVLTESAALKYFGDKNPVSENLVLENRIILTVTGIVKNVPGTSSINFDFLVSIESAKPFYEDFESITKYRTAGFVLLKNEADQVKLNEKFQSFVSGYFPDSPESPERIYLFPFLKFRLHSIYIDNFMLTTMAGDQYLYMSFGIILLIIVGINFINLSTARYLNRTHEIVLRKIVGAGRSQLIKQFMGESILISFIALPAGILLYEGLIPVFTLLLSGNLNTSISIFDIPFLIKYLLEATLLVGFLSGIYPAVFLSSLKPASVIKGDISTGKGRGRGRKILVVTQFSLSIILIILSGTLHEQFNYLLKTDLGFSRENILVTNITGLNQRETDLFREDLAQNPYISSVSTIQDLPVRWQSEYTVIPENGDNENVIKFDLYGIEAGTIESLNMEMLGGSRFSGEFNEKNSFIINETAVERLQWEMPLGKQLTINGETGTVTGVVKDFQFRYVGYDIYPAVLQVDRINPDYLLVKVSSAESIASTKQYLRDKWLEQNPDHPFACYTLEEKFIEGYKYIDTFSGIMVFAGAIAVFFSCIGLLGLASFFVERRIKEIGIRKVLGSSVTGIIWMFLKDFLIIVIISNIIGIPLAYFASDGLLQLAWRSYSTDVGTEIITFAVLITFLTSVTAVVSQTLKAARANPVNSLRYE